MPDVQVRLKADATPARTINAETAAIAEKRHSSCEPRTSEPRTSEPRTSEPRTYEPHSYVGSALRYVGSALRRIHGFTFAIVVLATVAHAQTPVVVERVTFQQAIDRAIANNPSAAVAAAGILRAEGLLAQARAGSLLQVTGNIQTTTLNKGVAFQGATVQPRSQLTASLTVDQPIVAAAAWARRAQARDNVQIAELTAVETRRQIGLATADA